MCLRGQRRCPPNTHRRMLTKRNPHTHTHTCAHSTQSHTHTHQCMHTRGHSPGQARPGQVPTASASRRLQLCSWWSLLILYTHVCVPLCARMCVYECTMGQCGASHECPCQVPICLGRSRKKGQEILWVLCLRQEEDMVTTRGHSSRIQRTLALSSAHTRGSIQGAGGALSASPAGALWGGLQFTSQCGRMGPDIPQGRVSPLLLLWLSRGLE